MADRSDPERERTARFFVWLGALVCLLFASSLRDIPFPLAIGMSIPAPMLPTSVGERDADLAVVVEGEDGKALAGSSVRVFAMRDGKAYFAGDRNADASGRAVFKGLPRGPVWILAYDGGKARSSSQAVLDAGLREVVVVLKPAKALDVVVVDDTDHPVEGASVEVTTGDPLPFGALTSKAGAARLDRLGAAPYRVRVTADGFDEASRSGIMPGPVPLRIKLERPGGLTITVVDSDDKPQAGATVLTAGSGLWPARSTTTGDDGTTHIFGLRGGVYDVKARLGEQVSKTELGVPVKKGERKDVKLVLGPGKKVRVTVTEGEADGAPRVPNADVVLVEEGLSSFPLQGRTGGDGSVELGPIAKDRASVSAKAQGFVGRTVTLPAGEVALTVALRRGGVLAGDVVDDRGFPIAGASIEVIGVDEEGMPIDETSAMIDFRDTRFEVSLPGPRPLIPMGELGVMPGPIPDVPKEGAPIAGLSSDGEKKKGGDPWVTRADGTFRCDPVPPGRVHAIVRHPSYVEAMSDLVTVRSGLETSIHVVLHQGGWIEGRVLEEDRTPVGGARVTIAATKGSLEKVAYTADDGTFTFASVPDEVLLGVSRPGTPGEVVAKMVLDVPERDRREVEILLPKQRDTVTIRITDDRGFPVERAEVRCLSLDLESPLRRTLFTNKDGEAELPDAVGLPLRLTTVRPGKAPRVDPFDVAPAKITIVMEEGVEGHGKVTGRDGRDKLEGVELTFFTEAGARRTKTDRDGEYVIKDLSPGRVRVTVAVAEYAPGEVALYVVPDRFHEADLGTVDLYESGEVEGEVVDARGDPISGARVGRDSVPTYLPMGPLPRGIVSTDREGAFKLTGIPEGRVVLEAYFSDLGRARVEVDVRARRTTDRVRIVLDGSSPSARDPKGAGSLAVTLGETTDEEGVRRVVVRMVPAGSEAEVSGIEQGDEIHSINGHEVRTLEGARKLLTGPLGEDLVMVIQHDDEESETRIRVRRERVRR